MQFDLLQSLYMLGWSRIGETPTKLSCGYTLGWSKYAQTPKFIAILEGNTGFTHPYSVKIVCLPPTFLQTSPNSWLVGKSPQKMHRICHSKSNFPTSSWRMPWALAGPMPHGRRHCPGLDAKHRRHRCQVLRSGSEVAPTSKPCRIELRMTSC